MLSMSASPATSMRLAPSSRCGVMVRLAGNASSLIWLMTLGLVVVGAGSVALWIATREGQAFGHFFRYGGLPFRTGLAIVECLLAVVCWRLFERGEPLRSAWAFITAASGFRLVGLAAASASGALLSNLASMALMGVGLLMVLKVYRKLGLLRQPGLRAIAVLLPVGAFLAIQLADMFRWLLTPNQPASILKVAGWVAPSLLGLLMVEAVLLYRAVMDMGDGLIGACWGAYTIAIFLTSFGDAGAWAMNRGLLPGQYLYVNFFVWLVASLAYSLGPAFQVEAVVRAGNPRLGAR
jgi:hypothetical protein